MSRTRIQLLAAFALLLITISIFGRGVGSHGFFSLFTGAGGEYSEKVTRRASVPFQTPDGPKPKQRAQFTIYRNVEGEVVCRQATEEEIRERESINSNAQGLRRINHFELTGEAAQGESLGSGLTIVLRATQQLQQNPTATAAFTRAAQNWEAIIMSPVTIYIDVDYGTTNFGQTWPSGVLGATAVPSKGYPYSSVRTNLIAEANGEGNSTKQGIFNALPATTIPTDLGDGSGTDVADANGRAIGLLPATAQSTDDAARIGFNSNFSFDFDPSDGITAGTDFDAVATHEIGHALGLSSDAGTNIPRPSVWDFYRFRTGTTSGTFTNAQRIMTIGGSPDPLQFFFVPGNSELGLSTGGPAGSSSNGGDGWQSSHWKHVSGCVTPIGVMDPAIPSGCRRTISANDQLALSSFGYNFTNNNALPPPPPPPTPPANDNFANAQTISGCSGSTTGVTFGATSEAGEPSHDPPDSTSLSPSHSVWYQWQAPSSGSNTITTAGSDFDTILAVYTGSSVGSLTRLVFNDDVQDGVIRSSTVTFNATAGTTYSIAVDGWGGDTGAVKLNWSGCNVPTPTPTPTPTPIPSPTPTPTPTPGPCPTTLTVNDAGDANDFFAGEGVCATAGGVCTLRAAIQEANARASCGPVDINFSQVAGLVTLNSALPNINHNLNINGPDPSQLTIQRSSAVGTPNFRILNIVSGTVTVSGLSITNGNGAISNGGTLTLTNSVLRDNSVNAGIGGVISDIGTFTVVNGTISGNPTASGAAGTGIYIDSAIIGGVAVGGTVTLVNSVISGNAAGGVTLNGAGGVGTLTTINTIVSGNTGSGISNGGGTVRLTNSTVSANTDVGISIAAGSLTATNTTVSGNKGGGIVNSGGVGLVNCTVSGNSSSGFGGGISSLGPVVLTNTTISGNSAASGGGGIFLSTFHSRVGTLTLRNTIIANNTISTGSGPDINGNVVSEDYNLIGNTSGAGFTGTTTHNITNVNALLGSLANNGGPTMTHALLAGSPAINTGSNALAVDQNGSPLTTDQRGVGFSRIVGGTVDIGAFEVQPINQIDQPDFFVKQHYLDFLNRTADQSGLDFWTSNITSCGSDAGCIEVKRINVSAAFFLSIEFQQTGNLVYKIYKAGFGNLPGGKPVAVDRAPFMNDTRQIQSTPAQVIVGQGNWQQQLETNKQAFALAFVQRANFQTQHASQNATDYVNTLFTNAGVTNPDPSEVSTAMTQFNTAGGGDAGRAAALRSVCESSSVHNKLFNEAFVLMQYFGYLQRNPYDPPESTLDYQGYNFWLNKLNSFGGDYNKAEMVKAFIASDEYRHRFGP